VLVFPSVRTCWAESGTFEGFFAPKTKKAAKPGPEPPFREPSSALPGGRPIFPRWGPKRASSSFAPESHEEAIENPHENFRRWEANPNKRNVSVSLLPAAPRFVWDEWPEPPPGPL